MKKGISFIVFIMASVFAVAQDSLAVPKRFKYFFTLNTGFLAGERMKSLTFTFNTVHGVKIGKRFRAGVGFGIDSYRDIQTMPLLGQVSFDLLQFKKANAIFLQTNYGWAHAWSQVPDGYASYPTSGGKVLGAMLGYRLAAGDLTVSVGAGYKYQETRSSYQSPQYVGFLSYYSPFSQETEHNYERFTVILGVGWR